MRAKVIIAVAFAVVFTVAYIVFGAHHVHGPRSEAGVASGSVQRGESTDSQLEQPSVNSRDPVAPPTGGLEVAVGPLIRVIDSQDGKSVGVADMWVRADSRVIPIGKTDPCGEYTVKSWPVSASELIVSAATYARSVFLVPTPLPPVYELRLQPGLALAGRVQLIDGSPPGVQLRVVAWRVGIGDDTTTALRALDGDPGVLAAMTAEDGSFHIDGALADSTYRIAACGHGYIARPEKGSTAGNRTVHAGDNDIRLLVCRAYAAELMVVEKLTGRPVRCSRQLFGITEHTRVSDTEVRMIAASSIEDILAGLYLPREDYYPGHQFFVFVTDRLKPKIGPITYDASVPGYKKLSLSYQLTPLSGGVVPVRAEIEQTGNGFGSVQVSIRGLGLPAQDESAIAFSQAMISLIGTESGITYWMPAGVEGMILADFPSGTYRAEFEMCYGSVRVPDSGQPPITLSVSDSRQSPLELDLTWTGAMKMHLRGPEDVEFHGSVLVMIIPDQGSANHVSVIANKFPVRLGGLAPGWHTVSLRINDHPEYREIPPQRVQIVQREVSSITFRIQ